MEHLQEQAIRLQNYLEKKLDSKKRLCYYKAKTRKLETDEAKKLSLIFHY